MHYAPSLAIVDIFVCLKDRASAFLRKPYTFFGSLLQSITGAVFFLPQKNMHHALLCVCVWELAALLGSVEMEKKNKKKRAGGKRPALYVSSSS
jgi:hypothetical protein